LPALYERDHEPEGFRWIDANDNENSIISFVRVPHHGQGAVVMVVNFTPVPRQAYRIGIPEPGYWAEVVNSDSAHFGGSNMGNGGGVHSEAVAAHGFAHSISLLVPPLGCLLLQRA
jgi:1,4-alpha-glucan branching enzyme